MPPKEEDRHPADDLLDDWAAALAVQGQATQRGPLAGTEPPAVRPLNLEYLMDESAETQPEGALDLSRVLEIPVTLAVELGTTEITIRELLQLNQGSVVELDRLAGEPLAVLVNGTLVAHGEVVVVDEKFGIRLTDVVSAQERVKKLK
jgi:flagellar motor switch protein FliN/FliY